MDESSEKLQKSATAFVTRLRMGGGFNEEQFSTLKDALRTFFATWSSSDMLPKSAVVSLIDLPRIVEACAAFYSGSERQQIVVASHELVDAILEGF